VFEIISVCNGGGYRYCRTMPPHPKRNSNGLYPLHRVLMENQLGRLLRNGEDVHHKDEDKTNDDPSNLEVLTKSEHGRRHKPEADRIEVACPCGKSFRLKPHQLRLRQRRAKNRLCCSLKCAGMFSRPK
jgi:hypothetical protein